MMSHVGTSQVAFLRHFLVQPDLSVMNFMDCDCSELSMVDY